MKKALGETQTLRAGRSNTEPKTFSPAADPFPGAQDCQNLISWRWSLPSPTNPVWWKSMHEISSYRGKSPTPPARLPVANTQTGPITIHCAAKLSAQCINITMADMCCAGLLSSYNHHVWCQLSIRIFFGLSSRLLIPWTPGA